MNRTLLAYLMPVLLLVASILQSTAANRVEIRNVKPDLVLLLVVAGALVYGSRAAVGWAFLGGVGLDLFSGGPLGSSSLALVAAALVVGVGRHTLSRFNVVVPVTATALGTLVYGATYVAILAVLEGLTGWLGVQGITLDLVQPDLPVPLWSTLFWPTMQIIVLPAMVYNTALSVALIPLLNQVPELEY